MHCNLQDACIFLNISLILQLQATGLGLLASFMATVLGWMAEGKMSFDHVVLLCSTSVSTAFTASLLQGKNTTRCHPKPIFFQIKMVRQAYPTPTPPIHLFIPFRCPSFSFTHLYNVQCEDTYYIYTGSWLLSLSLLGRAAFANFPLLSPNSKFPQLTLRAESLVGGAMAIIFHTLKTLTFHDKSNIRATIFNIHHKVELFD